LQHRSIPCANPRPARLALPVWVHLNVFALLVLLPLWCLLGYGAWNSVQEKRAEQERRTLLLARELAPDLERELTGFGGLLKALATSPSLRDRNFELFQSQATQVLPPGTAIVLRDLAGQQIVNTLFPFGSPLPKTHAQTVLDADACVVRTADACTSDLFIGTSDAQPYVVLNAPVIVGGRIAYMMNVAIAAQRMATLLAGAMLPAGWTASVIDRQNVVIARWPDHARFVGQLATGPVRSQAVGESGSFHSVTLDGVPVRASYVRLPTSGWRVAVGVPEAVLEAPLRESAIYLGAAGLLAMALSAAAALVYGRHLSRAIGKLTLMARQIGLVEAPQPVATAIREINQVGQVLASSAIQLRASMQDRDVAQADLRRLNEELEGRVRTEVVAREEAQRRAAQAQRLQALGQLAGGIAHDFNNVLQATAGGAGMIERQAGDEAAVRRFAQLILRASDRGTSVTRRLLGFAKQNDLRAAQVDLVTLFAGLDEMLTHTLGTHIAVQIAIPASLEPAFADRGQLETVLVNLATNARDAMPDGGHLTFAVETEVIETGRHSADLQAGRYLRITVTDTGAGMEPALLARATEPFFTTKGRGQGTGLGLAMARGFAEQSGGALAIDSRPGKGTEVRIWLPVGAAHAPKSDQVPAAPATFAPPSGPVPRLRILLVEDEAIVREVVAAQLSDEGYEVATAQDGTSALALLDGGTQFGSVVTDFNMPGMNGIELIRKIRSRGLTIPTILLTGNAEDDINLTLEPDVAHRFAVIRKPVSGAELADRVVALTDVETS
jgi:signal transduction histidine kinase